MTKPEKRIFIRNLCNSIRDEVMEKVTTGAIPREWDGVELRVHLAEKFEKETYRDLIKGKRLKDYRNTVIVNNL